MSVTIFSSQIIGLDAKPISVEIDISPGLHIFSIVGLADKEVQESRERIAAAIKNLGAMAPHKKSQRVIVNLAPADIKKEGPAFDLPIALGYLLASNQIDFNPQGKIFLGELGLGGNLRKITGVLPIAIAARMSGFSEIFLPRGNGAEASILEGLKIFEAENLSQIIDHLSEQKKLSPLPQASPREQKTATKLDFKDIRGQEATKRALTVAAAGEHNILMTGPPGSGKTILAQALPSILPNLSFSESLETTKIYSVAGILNEDTPFISERPFRNPHHTASHTAVIGGGSYPRPGEITLAHNGVLFLDEFPEFDRRVIESLRQPLEEKNVTISRTFGKQTFPANFMLVAAMNPCPCGNFGNPKKECICASSAVSKYNKKISGPMLDRIDIHIEVPSPEFDKLSEGEESDSSEKNREEVEKARDIQKKRLKGLSIQTNSEMGLREIKQFIKIKDSLKPVLKLAHERFNLSARSYHRVLKLARTIADLANSEEIEENHLAEALSYRPRQEP